METLTGVKDADREILARIESDKELLQMCLLNKYSVSLCDNNFYRNRLANKFPNLFSFYPANTDWKLAYLQNMYYIGKMSEVYSFNFSAVSKGLPKIYYDILEKSKTSDEGLKIAGSNGFFDLADFFISRGASAYVDGLISSIIGHKNINTLKYFIDKIDPAILPNVWDMGFQTATAMSNSRAMDYFVDKIDKTNALINVAISKNYRILNYLLSKGANAVEAIQIAEQRNLPQIAILLEKYYTQYLKVAALKK